MNLWEHNLNNATNEVNQAQKTEAELELEELDLLNAIDKAYKTLGSAYVDRKYSVARIASVELNRNATRLAIVLGRHQDAVGAVARAKAALRALWDPVKPVKSGETAEPPKPSYTG